MMLLVITNMPDAASAEQLAHTLISSGAAACVNMLAPCTSLYRWQGKLERATEIPLLIKLAEENYARVETLIQQQHPYELPEIIAVPVSAALPEYLDWVSKETRSSQE